MPPFSTHGWQGSAGAYPICPGVRGRNTLDRSSNHYRANIETDNCYTHTLTVNLDSSVHLTGNWNARRRAISTKGEHANSTQKGRTLATANCHTNQPGRSVSPKLRLSAVRLLISHVHKIRFNLVFKATNTAVCLTLMTPFAKIALQPPPWFSSLQSESHQCLLFKIGSKTSWLIQPLSSRISQCLPRLQINFSSLVLIFTHRPSI